MNFTKGNLCLKKVGFTITIIQSVESHNPGSIPSSACEYKWPRTNYLTSVSYLSFAKYDNHNSFLLLPEQITTSLVVYNNINILLYNFGVQKSKMDHIGLKLRCWQGWVLPEAQEENLPLCLLQLPGVVCIMWPFCICKVHKRASSYFSVTLTCCFSPPNLIICKGKEYYIHILFQGIYIYRWWLQPWN